MEAREAPVHLMLEGSKQFVVPLYQRAYAWQDQQLEQLWADLTELTKDGQAEHFLGTLVLAPLPGTQAAGPVKWQVVDGQQRLTTLTVLLCALRDRFEADERTDLAEQIEERFLFNKWSSGDERPRLVSSRADRPGLDACLAGDGGGAPGRIGAAYCYFATQLASGDPKSIFAAATNRLTLVTITAGQSDNVHGIFASINGKGLPLTQGDLIRNLLFSKLPTRAEQVYEDHWFPLEQLLDEVERDELLWLDRVVRGEAKLRRDDVYRAHQKQLDQLVDEDEVAAYAAGLHRRARHLAVLLRSETEPDPAVRSRLRFLADWGASTTYPLLVHLLALREDGECTSQDIAEALWYVESFLVRRMFAGISVSNLNRIFNALIPLLPGDLPIADAVRSALAADRKRWPSDAVVEEAILTRSFYTSGRSQQRLLVLRRLEETFAHVEKLDWSNAKISIEHVLPQTLNDEWRATLSRDGDPDELHDQLVHTLGNLTLTGYNGTLSNHPFDRKREVLRTSHFELSRAIAPQETWGPAEIRQRGRDLAQRTLKAWGGPPSVVAADHPARDDRSRAKTAVSRLVDAGALPVGSVLRFQATTEVNEGVRTKVTEWVGSEPSRGRATWTGESPLALRWEHDGQTYSPSGLVRKILLESAGNVRKPRGSAWWVAPDGLDLAQMADQLPDAPADGA